MLLNENDSIIHDFKPFYDPSIIIATRFLLYLDLDLMNQNYISLHLIISI